MKTEKLITRFNDTGECEVDVKEVIKKWNHLFLISQWKEEYTLLHQNKRATNFTKTDLKVKISKRQAKEIIVELNLMPIQSPIFNSAKTWK